ncbi:uncharacterized protein PHALS_14600 [Plasmopara halstedii]|uniref:Uncharacterized protein n=1 Tax=Plasmopara halstedii TaxID=4781 RepID=A0A0P1ALX0_PLAHL|nr:uncharacterized protein PHALS_14600 [Plasmopara halstedii]CEG42176.1 hypothetical protein PHALS_14600 [Plasmopara halstedii]|eukprot:XP_024578545.1 hypothetical protein PHALS_14600 [Plasmopara halstedii]
MTRQCKAYIHTTQVSTNLGVMMTFQSVRSITHHGWKSCVKCREIRCYNASSGFDEYKESWSDLDSEINGQLAAERKFIA